MPTRADTLPDEASLRAGFESVVFGAEIAGPGSDASYLKKFDGPVRFAIRNSSELDRTAEVVAFVGEIAGAIDGLDAALAGDGDENFTVHVVDRARYQEVGRSIYADRGMKVPGNCIVRSSFDPSGIRRSDAILVSDEGRALFRRCLVEEVLQGLGPLNDNADAPGSVFNDTSVLTEFTVYDRAMLSILYDPRLRPGMREADARPLLPAIVGAVRERLVR